jgi:hypothetical protein
MKSKRKPMIKVKVEYEDVMQAFRNSINMYRDLIKVSKKRKIGKKKINGYKEGLKKKIWAMKNMEKFKKGFDIYLCFDGSFLCEKKNEKRN